MRVLFVISDLYFSEPLGAMILSAVCRRAGHDTSLVVLRSDNLVARLDAVQPDLVAYSTMTPDESLFQAADREILAWAARTGHNIKRIMGGPHPTFFPDVLDKMGLDAICSGDGERAILRILEAIESNRAFDGIPNVSTRNHREFQKEIVEDMDAVPYADRDLLYDADPEMLKHGIRSFLTQKGCPYKCTYCFNHAYNRMFKGEGRKILRRRTVDSLIHEIKDVVARYPVCRFIRFADDVFVINNDEWLEEFAEKYPREIGIPFYCLIRANSLSEDVARLLAKAGCRSLSMSIESGDPRIRNEILKRNMPDEMLRKSFEVARNYKLNVFGNSILAVPGTTFDDDWQSFVFARELKPAAPTFSIFSPFPNTDLTRYAQDLGLLAQDFDYNAVSGWDNSVLSGYSDEDKRKQTNLAYLGLTFCKLPDFMVPVLKYLIRLPLTRVYRMIGSIIMTYTLSVKIFPGAHPRDPRAIVTAIWRSLKYLLRPQKQNRAGGEQGMQSPGSGLSSPDY